MLPYHFKKLQNFKFLKIFLRKQCRYDNLKPSQRQFVALIFIVLLKGLSLYYIILS